MVAIRKTEVHGVGLYDQVRLGQHITSLPRPFLFSLGPSESHPNAPQIDKLSRILCLYDNAGEAFDPGEDSSGSPVTQHLAKSRVLMFLYDLIQDPRVRARCREVSNDPQLGGRSRRQETVLSETISRIRRYTALTAHQKHDRPIIVIVPKADTWGPLIQLDLETEPTSPHTVASGKLAGVDIARIESVSNTVRLLLLEYAPEFVAALEGFCSHVVYIPVSAIGRAPQQQDGQEGLFIRASEIRPKWVTVPFLYMCAKWATGLIGGVPSAPASQGVPPTSNPG